MGNPLMEKQKKNEENHSKACTIQIKVNSPPLVAGWQKFLASLEAMLTVET